MLPLWIFLLQHISCSAIFSLVAASLCDVMFLLTMLTKAHVGLGHHSTLFCQSNLTCSSRWLDGLKMALRAGSGCQNFILERRWFMGTEIPVWERKEKHTDGLTQPRADWLITQQAALWSSLWSNAQPSWTAVCVSRVVKIQTHACSLLSLLLY